MRVDYLTHLYSVVLLYIILTAGGGIVWSHKNGCVSQAVITLENSADVKCVRFQSMPSKARPGAMRPKAHAQMCGQYDNFSTLYTRHMFFQSKSNDWYKVNRAGIFI